LKGLGQNFNTRSQVIKYFSVATASIASWILIHRRQCRILQLILQAFGDLTGKIIPRLAENGLRWRLCANIRQKLKAGVPTTIELRAKNLRHGPPRQRMTNGLRHSGEVAEARG
jgi:hypothetical protein